MSLAWLMPLTLGVVLGAMLILWLVSLRLRDASIVDPFWGTGFAIVAWVTFALVEGGAARQGWLVALTTLWGLRLSLYLGWRNLGKGEDYRYQQWRREYGERFPWVSLFMVFGLQGVLMWVVSLPIQVGQAGGASAFPWLVPVGVAVFTVGFLFESVGDLQLARFKRDPENRGQVLDRGLWRYTRHPNYFGDFLVWWGLYLVAASSGHAWWTIVGPVVMSVLLLRVSGVTLLERHLEERRPGYRDYVRRTSAFFPWPPRAEPNSR